MRVQQQVGDGCALTAAAKSRTLARSLVHAPICVRGFVRTFLSFFGCLVWLVAYEPAFANDVDGDWLSPATDNWPFVAVHAALTPDGRVLTFGSNAAGDPTGLFQYDVWDPAEGLSGGHVTMQNYTLTDIFCSYAVVLPFSGDMLIAGGDNWDGAAVTKTGNDNSTVFNPSDNLLTRTNDMQRPRWYATATPLMNGEIYIQGGKNGEDVAEVRDVAGGYRALNGFSTLSLDWWYPRNFLAPDGRVFGFDGDGAMYFVNPSGQGTYIPAGVLGSTNMNRLSTSVMYEPGKILHVVGRNKKALLIDINGAQPAVSETGYIAAKRVWANSTVLPDGKVVVTGGSAVDEVLEGVTNYAEIWDPQTGAWHRGASGSRPRLYHSIALLLPDATVLVAGGGASDNAPLDNLHAEIYYPPYLYNSSGGFAARPTIVSAPGVVAAGQTFPMEVGGAGTIQRVTLLAAGSATHSTNLQQRFVELQFESSGETLLVDMPTRATDIPPGYYLLFVINGSGVPSKASMVRINVSGSGGGGGGDIAPPTVPQGLTLTKVNGNPKLTWSASSDNVGVSGYAIHRATSNGVGPEIGQTGNTSWIDTAVVEGTKYWYAVKARDAAGNASQASALKSIVAYAKPTKPGDFSVTLSSGEPKLTFSESTDNVGVVGYNVYRSTNGTLGPLFAQIAGSPWVDAGAQAGVTYTYAVRARDAAGYRSAATALKSIEAQ